jgi:hypothetical protein
MTEDNIRFGRSGEPQCKECLRIHLAAVRRRKRPARETADEIADKPW